MARISDEDIGRVRDATDLVSLVSERVVLRQKGRLFWGNCPFHGEKTPSFKVDPATQLWHCFGCGLGGDAYGFLMRSENLEFPDAVRLLAERAHIELVEEEGGVPRGTKERLYAALAEAADYYHTVLTGSRDQGAATARDYLSGRGFGTAAAKEWKLGFAPGRGALVARLTAAGFTADEMIGANLALRGDGGQLKDRFYERVMFPISDLQGRIIAFGGRVIGSGEPKYLNTNDTPVFHKSANMYAIDKAKGAITVKGQAIVVEGYTDVIALHEAGIKNVVATLGTALTRQHVKLLGRFAKQVVYLFDGDEAGLRAADRAVEFIDRTITPEAGASRVELLVAVLPAGADPADVVGQRGSEGVTEVVKAAQPLLQFAIDRRLARWDLDRPEERAKALAEAVEVLVPIKESLLANDYTGYIAGRLFADFVTVRRAVDSAKPRVAFEHQEAEPDAVVTRDALVRPSTPEAKAMRDVIALMVHYAHLRSRAQELLAESLMSDDAYRTMAQVIADAVAGAEPAALVGAMEGLVPGASVVLAEAPVGDESDEEAVILAQDLTRRIKEFALERRIAREKARLKSPEVVKDGALSDDIVREVSALQRELDALRRGALQ